MISEAHLISCIEQLMPIKNRPQTPPQAMYDVELCFVEQGLRLESTAQGHQLFLLLRILSWEREPARIRSITEQEVLVAKLLKGMPAERFIDFLHGWAMALEEVFSQNPERFQSFMPGDLACADASALIRPKDAQDFKVACLTKSRLGRWVA